MASTYTTRGRANLQGTGDNTDAWGPELNNGALQRLDDMWGGATITVNGNVTLTVENSLADQSRGFVIRMSGAGGFAVTHPDVDKPYLLANDCAAAVTFQPNGGTGVSVPAGWRGIYYTNAAGDTGYLVNLRLDQIAAPTASVSLNSQKITNLADPTAAQDAVTKNWVETEVASNPDLATVAGIASEIITLADIEDGTVATNAISDLAPVAANVAILSPVATDIAQLADMFVGASATAPTTRLDGSALQAGDYYLNTTGTPTVNVYDGSNWIPIAALTKASQAEAEAGANDTNYMTPLKTAQAITAQATRYALRPIGVVTILNNVAAVDILLSGGYDEYEIHIRNVVPATDAVLMHLRTSTNAGSTFDAGASDYGYSYINISTAGGSVTAIASNTSAQAILCNNVGSDVNEVGVSGVIRIFRPSAAQYLQVMSDVVYADAAGNTVRSTGLAVRKTAADVDAVRILFSSGNLESGQVQLYGVQGGV